MHHTLLYNHPEVVPFQCSCEHRNCAASAAIFLLTILPRLLLRLVAYCSLLAPPLPIPLPPHFLHRRLFLQRQLTQYQVLKAVVYYYHDSSDPYSPAFCEASFPLLLLLLLLLLFSIKTHHPHSSPYQIHTSRTPNPMYFAATSGLWIRNFGDEVGVVSSEEVFEEMHHTHHRGVVHVRVGFHRRISSA